LSFKKVVVSGRDNLILLLQKSFRFSVVKVQTLEVYIRYVYGRLLQTI